MALFDSSDIYMKFKYRVAEFTLIVPPDPTTGKPSSSLTLTNERIVSIGILHDYEKYAFPIFKFTSILETSVYKYIMDNKKTIKFKIRIQKYYTDASGSNPSMMRDCINDTFELIMDDDYNDFDYNLKQEESKKDLSQMNKPNNNDLFAIDNSIELYLFKSDTIQKTKTIVNDIIPNGTVSDAINYILTKIKLNNFLISPIKNITVYPELLIPSGKASYALNFIDTYYGLYPTGSLIYFDFNRSYILEYKGECTAYEPEEIREVSIIIPSRTSRHNTVLCSLKKNNSNVISYVIGNPQTFDPKNKTITFDLTTGASATVINNNTVDVSKTKANVNTSVTGVESSVIIENTTQNNWIGTTYTAQASALSVVLNIDLSDYDIDIIAPNKKFSVIFEDSALSKKYKGVYMISRISHDFTKLGNDFSVMSKIVLKKTT